MRAVRLHAFGQPLRVDDVPEPEPGPGESLLQVRFASVNPLDVWLTEGTVWGGQQTLPFVPGSEGTGVTDGGMVAVHGAGLGVRRDGLYRVRAAVPQEATLPLPHGADPAQAAAAGVAGSTAWMLVHEVAKVGPDDRVLVLGASGGVGSLVTQLATAAGATVWGQAGTEEKAEFVRDLGVGRAVVVRTPEELASAAADLQATVVFDPLGDGYTSAAVAALVPFGRLALYGASAGAREDFDLRSLYRKSIQLVTYSGTIEPEERSRRATAAALEAIASGELRVPIDDILPLEDANEAHRRIRERRVRGKLLLAP